MNKLLDYFFGSLETKTYYLTFLFIDGCTKTETLDVIEIRGFNIYRYIGDIMNQSYRFTDMRQNCGSVINTQQIKTITFSEKLSEN